MLKFQQLSYKGLEKRIKDTQNKLIDIMNQEGFDYKEFRNSKEHEKLSRKIWKAFYLKERFWSFQQYTSKHLINAYRNQRDYDYWNDVYVFNTTDLEIVKDELEEMNIQIDGSEPFYSEYDCTGRTMFSSVNVYQLTDRIVVTQSGSLDV